MTSLIYDVFEAGRHQRCSFLCLQDRSLPLTLRMASCEQLAERYQICMEEGREFEIDDLLQECERHHREGTLREFVAEKSLGKGRGCGIFSSVGVAEGRTSGALWPGTSAPGVGSGA